MIVSIDKGGYLEIYSDAEKKILETTNGILWNAKQDAPIAVDKNRFANGDYVESDEPLDPEEQPEEENGEEIHE